VHASEKGQLNQVHNQEHLVKIQPNDYKSLSKQHLVGWKIKEDQLRSKTGQLYGYFNRISKDQYKCFGGKKEIIS
jgi:hypothetical protein